MLPEEGTFDMLHYALAEAQAVQRGGWASGIAILSSPQLQMQHDQHQLQLGNTSGSPCRVPARSRSI